MAAKSLTALDRSFLTAETRDVMMHVGVLLPFSPPKKGRGELMKQLREDLTRKADVQRPWNLKLKHPDVLSILTQAWIEDESFDIDYHVRRSALPSPGDERELGILVSRLHGTPLDFHRPPWEAHFIEGLEGDRMAIYFKVHHSLIDGYTGMRMLIASLTTDADELDTPWFWERPPVDRARKKEPENPPTFDTLVRAARDQVGVTKDVGRALVNVIRAVRKPEAELVAPMQAPKSVLNQKITRGRRFATQLLPMDRLKRVATKHGATVNDVVLAVCGSSLRKFLVEQDKLPEKSLVAMLPVNVRPKDDPGGGSNAVGAILASLATDYSDDEERLHRIVTSTKKAKEQLQSMSKNAILQYSMLVMTPLMLSLVPSAVAKVRPAFNVVISNVPGPETTLYLRGWKLEATYPLSIPFHGYGLNITVQSYAGNLGFGFIGCRDTLPHLQRLAVYSGEVLETLES